MKFKEIKPGMVIHCPKEEDARALLEHLGKKSGECHWNVYEDETCYRVYGDFETSYGDRDYFKCLTITEFSDLLEPEPRFKVGDKVRVKKIKQEDWHDVPVSTIAERYEGAEFTIITVTECSDGVLYATYENGYNWSEEILEPVTSSEMGAVEMLEWIARHDSKKEIAEIFDTDAVCFSDLLCRGIPAEEIFRKITAYEAEKKKPKPVEVEWVDICQIHDEDGTIMDEVDITDCPLHDTTEKIMKDYNIPNKTGYYATIERRCRVKEGKA